MKNSKLVALELNRLSNAEVAQFITRFLDDFSKSGLSEDTDVDFKNLLDSLKVQLPVFNASLDQIRSSEESSKITKADTERDDAFKALRNALNAYQKTKENSEKESFTKLNLLISEYKDVMGNNYEVQTKRITNLVERLQSDTYKSDVKELAIGKFVTRLAASNTHFEQLFAKRSFETSQRQNYDTKSLKKELLDNYRKIATYIMAIADVRQDDFYKDTLVIINNSRKYFADTILARRTKKKESKKEDKTE